VVQPKVTIPGGPHSIGVLLTPNFVKTEMLRSDSVVEAAGMAAQYTNTLIQQTAAGFLSILTVFVSGLVGTTASAGAGGASITGLIGLIKVAFRDCFDTRLDGCVTLYGGLVGESWCCPCLSVAGVGWWTIGVFVWMEAFSGRKVNQRTQEDITNVTLLFLLLLVLVRRWGIWKISLPVRVDKRKRYKHSLEKRKKGHIQ